MLVCFYNINAILKVQISRNSISRSEVHTYAYPNIIYTNNLYGIKLVSGIVGVKICSYRKREKLDISSIFSSVWMNNLQVHLRDAYDNHLMS